MQNMGNKRAASLAADDASTPNDPRALFAPMRVRVGVVVSSDTSRTFQGWLLELSAVEVKLSVASPIAVGEFLLLNVAVRKLRLELNLLAEVLASESDKDHGHLLRCSLSPDLSEEVICKFSTVGRPGQRVQTRHAVCLPAAVSWGPRGTRIQATLQDFSAGGFSVLTNYSDGAGNQLVLHLDRDDDVSLIASQSRWSLKKDNGYLVGCAFRDCEDFNVIRDFLAAHSQSGEAETTSPS